MDSIVIEAEMMAERGIKEINIISQDTTYFGMDLKIKDGPALLLERLLAVQGIEWIRILYGYPEEISDSLLDIMTDDKICPYLDIPFQHSHPRIIRTMKRGMDGKEALDLIRRIRSRVPECAVRTSLIVGFPGEGKPEFNHLLGFVREARFNHLGVFTYSPEAGTPGFFLEDPVPEPLKEERRDEILAVQSEISLAHNERQEGRILDVLLEGKLARDPTIYVGRSRFQAPEVDGKVFMEHRCKAAGSMLKVEINKADVYDLYGEPIE
jgi:ribosomal protein S12 methylthiotransferase